MRPRASCLSCAAARKLQHCRYRCAKACCVTPPTTLLCQSRFGSLGLFVQEEFDLIGSRYTHVEFASDCVHAASTPLWRAVDLLAEGSNRIREFPGPHRILLHKFAPRRFHSRSGRVPIQSVM